jgi:hypothetical protein
MLGLAWRSSPGEQRDSHHHRAHAQDLAPAHLLAENARPDPEQHDEAHRQRRLDERERDQEERSDLRGPPEQSQARADEPARPPDQAAEQREAKVLLLGSLASLERLQPDRRGVQDGGREGERETGDDVHGQGAR